MNKTEDESHDSAGRRPGRWKPGRRGLIALVLLGCAVGWHFAGDGIWEIIDRTLVRNFRFVPGSSETITGTRGSMRNFLMLPTGVCVKVGADTTCYARSLSHHTPFGFRSGYSYVNVDGATYRKDHGPCTDMLNLQLAVPPWAEESAVTKAVVLEALEKDGFRLIDQGS
jgi:hypothetical protein